jgi:hypothetical protein
MASPSWSNRFWCDLPASERHALRGFLRSLEARYGPFDGVGRQYARLAAEAWWSATRASGEAIEATVKREQGRGRRTMQGVDRRRKRAGLNVGTFDQLVRRLDELAAGRKRTLAKVLAARAGS